MAPDHPADNPYAPPQTVGSAFHQPRGAWRANRSLVVHFQHPLPPVCVMTGAPATSYVNIRYGIVWLYRQRIPVSRAWQWQRWTWCAIYLICMILGPIALYVANSREAYLAAGVLGIPWLVVLSVLLSAWLTPFSATKREGPYLWVSGVSPEYLATLPPWPGRRNLEPETP